MANTIVNTNVSALNSHRAILSVGGRQARSAERLSSGMRINRAADDAAGLAISEGMRNQIRGLDQATRNSQDGISLVQTAEGALEEVHRILERARVLTNQAANGTYDQGDRALIAQEIGQIFNEISNITAITEFNGMNLLQGTAGDSFTGALAGASGGQFSVQSGANAGQRIDITIGDFLNGSGSQLFGATNNGVNVTATSIASVLDNVARAFGFNAGFNGSAPAGSTAVNMANHSVGAIHSGASLSAMLQYLDAAIDQTNILRANLGAVQNRLEHTINNLRVASENISASNSRIRDTDMAAEMMAYTQANVLQQAGMSMLAQANMAPQNVLQLVG